MCVCLLLFGYSYGYLLDTCWVTFLLLVGSLFGHFFVTFRVSNSFENPNKKIVFWVGRHEPKGTKSIGFTAARSKIVKPVETRSYPSKPMFFVTIKSTFALRASCHSGVPFGSLWDHFCVYVCVCVCMCVCVYVCMCMCRYVRICACVYVYVYVCRCVCVWCMYGLLPFTHPPFTLFIVFPTTCITFILIKR